MTFSYLTSRVATAFATLAVASVLVAWAVIGNYAAYIGAILALIAFVPAALHTRWGNVIRARWVWSYVGAFVLISIAFSLQTAPGSTSSIGDFIFFGLSPAFCVAVMPLAQKSFKASHVGWLFWLGSLAAAAWALAMAQKGVYRGSAIELSPIHFADLAMICGFSSLVVLFDTKSKWRWMVLTGPVCAFVVTFVAETRSGVVVAIGLAAACGIFLWRAWHTQIWKKLLALGSLLLLGVAAFYLASVIGSGRAFQVFDAMWKAISGDASLDSSTYARIEMYRAALAAIGESPWIGHGWHKQMAVSAVHMSQYAQELYSRESWGYIHNELLSLTVSAGLAGTIAYFLLLAGPFLAVRWRAGRNEQLIFIAVMTTVGIGLSGLTDVLFSVEIPKLFLVVTSAVLFALSVAEKDQSTDG